MFLTTFFNINKKCLHTLNTVLSGDGCLAARCCSGSVFNGGESFDLTKKRPNSPRVFDARVVNF
jgi:hypothetical protein